VKLAANIDGITETIVLEETDRSHSIAIGDSPPILVDVLRVEADVWSLIIDGQSYEATVQPIRDKLRITIRGATWEIDIYDPLHRYTQVADTTAAEGGQVISSPMPGRVVKIEVAVGDKVEPGQGIVIVEAMKMENELTALSAGIVKEIKVEAGQAVEDGQALVIIE